MVSARKRSFSEVAGESAELSPMLHRIRNMWQFACLNQFLVIFGDALKVDEYDVDDLEAECLSPHSLALQNIGLGLLKFLSSHRGLTHELFDEYTRRQFTSKAPDKPNPFGADELPAKFADFDVFTKIKVLHQMTLLILTQPEKLRERMAELKGAEHDHTNWRIEPDGWDRHDRSYFCLDDNRLYRMTEAPPPPAPAPKPKKNSKKARAAARASKRRQKSLLFDSDADDAGDEGTENESEALPPAEDDGLGGMRWECIGVTLEEVNRFLATLDKTKDPNEKALRERIQDNLVPILAKDEERRKKREREREKELINLEKMANAKRSSRIANKIEHQKQEEQAREEEQKRQVEEAARRKEEQLRLKMERERDNRMMSREQRLRERESRRLQHEEELAQLSEGSKGLGHPSGRMSERRLHAEIERNKQALKELEEEEEDWVFDCVCGLYGQVDDGEHSVSCERCSVWQHSKCIGIKQEEADSEDFHFVCDSCRRIQAKREQESLTPRRPVIKIKVNRVAPSSPTVPTATSQEPAPLPKPEVLPATLPSRTLVEIAAKPPIQASTPSNTPAVNGNAAPVQQPITDSGHLARLQPPPQEVSRSIPIKNDAATPGVALQDKQQAPGSVTNGIHNPFSSPHPDLSPPSQSPTKSRAYGTLYDPSTSSPPTADRNGPEQIANGVSRKISMSPALALPRPQAPAVSSAAAITAPTPKPATTVPTKTSTPVLSPPTLSPAAAAPNPVGNLPSQQPSTSPAPMVTPKFAASHGAAGSIYDEKSTPLPPSHAGLSPTKQSPLLSRAATNNSNLPSSSPTPPILPPATTLPPSPREQNLAPPVKSFVPPASPSCPPPHPIPK